MSKLTDLVSSRIDGVYYSYFVDFSDPLFGPDISKPIFRDGNKLGTKAKHRVVKASAEQIEDRCKQSAESTSDTFSLTEYMSNRQANNNIALTAELTDLVNRQTKLAKYGKSLSKRKLARLSQLS